MADRTITQRNARYRKRLVADRNWRRVEVMVPADRAGELRAFARRLRVAETPLQGVLRSLAKKYVWWKAPDEAIGKPDRVILQVMDIADYRDVQALARAVGEDGLRRALSQAEAGQLSPRSWAYWHYRLGLAKPGARTVADVTTCPGAESCNLAVTASRQVGAAITARLESDASLAAAVKEASATVIKVSGCPNSCGQHHIADIGWHGAARKVGERTAPVYQLHLGGGFDEDGARFGRQVVKIPARRVDEAVARLVALYSTDRADGETATAFYKRVPAARVHAVLDDLAALDATTPDEAFLDINESMGFRIAIGEGECAA